MMDGLWPRLTPWGCILWKDAKVRKNAQYFEFIGSLNSIGKSGMEDV